MDGGGSILVAIDVLTREATLFSAIWFLLGGLDDLAVDCIYVARRLRLRVPRGAAPPPAEAQPPMAVFVPAWDESAVIGQMLRATLARFDYPDYRVYVGTYPNDPATIAAAARVALGDDRLRLVVGPRPGPTTKADCLNALWRAMLRDEAVEGRRFAAVVLHDAEDVVHPLELQVFARFLPGHAAVQLPVLPLRHPTSRFVSGHYCDEFAETHAKQLLVRQAIGAGLPLAGVGCAIARDTLDLVAGKGDPFDATSLTEDYELGLTIGAMGGRTILARLPEWDNGPPVAVRAYFPATISAAVRQRARWLNGIALAGWDRTGWRRGRCLGDHWMRMRDRRVTLAMPVLMIAYCTLLLWGVSLTGHVLTGDAPPPVTADLRLLLAVNLGLLAWRVGVRALFVARAYGWREALWSVPRVLVANYIALLAARRALFLYVASLAGSPLRWDKTAHQFPSDAERTMS